MKPLNRLFRCLFELVRTPPKTKDTTDAPKREPAPDEGKAASPQAEEQPSPAATSAEAIAQETPDLQSQESYVAPHIQPQRNPYVVQIGFDFGTSSCKCVCRDITNQTTWVYVPESPADPEYPFLLPSALWIRRDTLGIANPKAHYHEGGLHHVKTALAACARKEWDDPSLKPYLRAVNDNNERLKTFIPACAMYLLAGYLGEIKKQIRKRHPGFGKHSSDYVMVNLAIPVADAQQPEVESLFLRVLQRAFKSADDIAGHPELSLERLEQYGRGIAEDNATLDNNSPCFVYPEVSANVQSFVRSPTAEGGIYFFCDTGAASVDQSVFIFGNFPDQPNRLTYLSARVLPLGSSRIEQKSMEIEGKNRLERLEYWRQCKENGDYGNVLRDAKNWIGNKLKQETVATLFQAKRQLPIQQQFLGMQTLFGGGGHMPEPYEQYALDAFADNSLRVPGPFAVNMWRPPFSPPVIGLPAPEDLDLPQGHFRWYKRLTVAYGLSFFKGDLTEYKFPDDTANEQIIGMPIREIPPAPGQEMC